MRTELPTCQNVNPSLANVTAYANGERESIKTAVCYGVVPIFDEALFRYIFTREAIRLWGPPWEKQDAVGAEAWLKKKIDKILYLLSEDPLGVGMFSKKIAGDETNWRNLAAFANYYWWLEDGARSMLENDIMEGNPNWTEHIIRWARPRTPVAVLTDPSYSSTQQLRVAQNETIDVDKLRGKGFVDGIWPVELANGLPASIPSLPTPCTPFPGCLFDGGLKLLDLDSVWAAISAFAAATPGVKQVRSQDGIAYSPEQADVDVVRNEPKVKDSPTWAWVLGAVGFTALFSWVIFSPSKGIVVR